MKEENYSAGNVIYSEKEECSHLYFIKSGEVEMSKEIPALKLPENENI